MSVARPAARCLLSRRFAFAAVTNKPAPTCHAPFHNSARLEVKRRPRFRNILAETLGLVTPSQVEKFAKETFRPYTPEELAQLRAHYTPAQMEALEAGEAAIDPVDLAAQGRLRRDPYRLEYLDDFSRTLPVVDKRPKKHPPPDPRMRWLSIPEEADDMGQFFLETLPPYVKVLSREALRPVTEEPTAVEKEELARVHEAFPEEIALMKQYGIKPDLSREGSAGESDVPEEVLARLTAFLSPPISNMDAVKYFQDRSLLKDNNAPSNSALAPALGSNIPGVTGRYRNPIDPADENLDDEGIYKDLKQRTGMTVVEIRNLMCKILVIRHVSNQTRLGKIRSAWILAIAGNGNGRLGIGVAKSTEHSVAVKKARMLAVQNMQPVRRYEHRTIYGSVTAKVGATVVKLDARPPGFGLRVSARFFEMFRAVGIRDIAAKMPRSRNPMNSVKACYQALMNQKDPDDIAIGRGKKMVDVRKVYFCGEVL